MSPIWSGVTLGVFAAIVPTTSANFRKSARTGSLTSWNSGTATSSLKPFCRASATIAASASVRTFLLETLWTSLSVSAV